MRGRLVQRVVGQMIIRRNKLLKSKHGVVMVEKDLTILEHFLEQPVESKLLFVEVVHEVILVGWPKIFLFDEKD